ncbi:MAG: helix-turn-helix domain-containing protein [Nocardioides sp.]|uniref:TetR/AcrR family transcriptional regulator n=1 Tax=Nocardioides sp. TaxID=35761 RepID=UPI0039E70BF6
MPTRRRLAPGRRRDELLDVGETVFSERPFEEISMVDIAAAAGVTRALLYHYFPTKAEFFGAIWARAHERLRASGRDRPDGTVRDYVDRSLRDYLTFYAAHLPLVVIANRSSIARDPAVRRPVERVFARTCATVLDAGGAHGRERRVAEVAFEGWIAFVRESSLATYLGRRISVQANLDLCLAAFDATVGRYVDLGRSMPAAD